MAGSWSQKHQVSNPAAVVRETGTSTLFPSHQPAAMLIVPEGPVGCFLLKTEFEFEGSYLRQRCERIWLFMGFVNGEMNEGFLPKNLTGSLVPQCIACFHSGILAGSSWDFGNRSDSFDSSFSRVLDVVFKNIFFFSFFLDR